MSRKVLKKYSPTISTAPGGHSFSTNGSSPSAGRWLRGRELVTIVFLYDYHNVGSHGGEDGNNCDSGGKR